MRRAGITLVEVLVAIMITGFGIISIIVLFPAGTIRLAEAFRQERASLAAYNADQFLRAFWQSPQLDDEPFFQRLEDPDGPTGPLPPATNPDEPSYPVVIDPLGIASGLPALWNSGSYWLIRDSFPRQLLGGNIPDIHRALGIASSPDGVYYDTDDRRYNRDYRYNWLWIVQRPRNRDKYVASMTVVVFDQRAPLSTNHELRCACRRPPIPVPGDNTNTIEVDNPIAGEFRNGYLMEVINTPTRRYKVHKIAEVGATPNGWTRIDLETPSILPPGESGIAVLWRGVAGVYERPMLTR